MTKNIFKVVNSLIDSRDAVTFGNAVNTEGELYDDSVENLHALQMLEPSLVGLLADCRAAGLKSKALEEVAELIGFQD